ncbi:hypothetical protein BSAF29S_05177 [Bacillus safensis subsp. safensis]
MKSAGSVCAVWTTTPWTLPANLGICVHPNLEYSVLQVGAERYVVASELVEQVATLWL